MIDSLQSIALIGLVVSVFFGYLNIRDVYTALLDVQSDLLERLTRLDEFAKDVSVSTLRLARAVGTDVRNLDRRVRRLERRRCRHRKKASSRLRADPILLRGKTLSARRGSGKTEAEKVIKLMWEGE